MTRKHDLILSWGGKTYIRSRGTINKARLILDETVGREGRVCKWFGLDNVSTKTHRDSQGCHIQPRAEISQAYRQ